MGLDFRGTRSRLVSIDWFSKFKVGQTVSLVIIFDEKQVPVTLKYMGKETVNAGNLGKKECYKIAIGAKTDVLKGKDKSNQQLINKLFFLFNLRSGVLIPYFVCKDGTDTVTLALKLFVIGFHHCFTVV
mgnify:CR=1 FL=1